MKNADIYPSIQNLIIFFICSVVGMPLNGLKKIPMEEQILPLTGKNVLVLWGGPLRLWLDGQRQENLGGKKNELSRELISRFGVEKASLEIKGKVKVCRVLKTAELTACIAAQSCNRF